MEVTLPTPFGGVEKSETRQPRTGGDPQRTHLQFRIWVKLPILRRPRHFHLYEDQVAAIRLCALL